MNALPSPKRQRRLQRLIDRDGAECVWCRTTLTAGDGLATVDHVVPDCLSRSGHRHNLVLACGPCNRDRGNRPALPWAVELGVDIVRVDVLIRALERVVSADLDFRSHAQKELLAWRKAGRGRSHTYRSLVSDTAKPSRRRCHNNNDRRPVRTTRVEPVVVVCGDEQHDRVRMFPALAAEKVSDETLWVPRRLRDQVTV